MSWSKRTNSAIVLASLMSCVVFVFPGRVDAQLIRSSEVRKDSVTVWAEIRGSSKPLEFEVNVRFSNDQQRAIFVSDVKHEASKTMILPRSDACHVFDMGGGWAYNPGYAQDVKLVRVQSDQTVAFRVVVLLSEDVVVHSDRLCISVGFVEPYEASPFEWSRPLTMIGLEATEDELMSFDVRLKRVMLGPFVLDEISSFNE